MTPTDDKHDRLIELLRATDPVAQDGAAQPADREAVRRRAVARLDADRPRPRRRLAFAFGGAAVAAAVAAVAVLLVNGGSVNPSSSPAYAKAAIAVAEANPRLLVGAPGWRVTGADEFEVDQGMMEFRNGERNLRLAWMPERSYYEPDVEQLRRMAEGPEGSIGNPITPGPGEIHPRFEWVTVRDRRAFFEYDINGRYYRLMFPPENGSYVWIEGHSQDDSMTRDEFLAIVDTLYSADVDSWLAALPPEIVRPADNEATVDAMLEGLPIPSSVDPEELRSLDLALSRYQLGAKVTSAVACGWLDQWAAAVESADNASTQEAIDAMATSHDWPILREMEDQGGWSQVIWEYAREMANDNRSQLLGVAGTETTPDGRVYELSPSYAVGIGCDSEQRILREDESRSDGMPRDDP